MLFEEFEKTSKEQWIAKATQDLKGENVLEKYKWSLQPDINVQPYYGKEDIVGLLSITSHDNALADTDNPQGEIRVWENRVEIKVDDEKKANKKALEALNQGADGILFVLSNDKVNPDELLKDIMLNYCGVSFKSSSNPALFIESYAKYIDQQEYNKNEIHGSLFNDGQGNIVQLCSVSKELENFKAITIAPIADDYTGQITDALIKATLAIDQLTENGFEPKEAFNQIGFQTIIGQDFFAEIAKIRALRITLYQLALAYKVDTKFHIHAICPSFTNEDYAPHGSMISGPTTAMSAIFGGCNSLTVQPEDPTSELEIRIARNVSNILKEESYLDKVADPAAGSYYITSLTNEMANIAWNNFKEAIDKL